MALFLSPYIGAGTKDDQYRPRGLDVVGASAVDIRLDPTVVDGGGIGFALLWSPSGIPDPIGGIKLAEDYGEPITNLLRNLINTRTGLDFSLDTTIQDVIETIMLRADVGHWKQLRPVHGRLELWLGSSAGKRKWIDSVVLAGGAITDSFNRANETPIAAPWTAQSGSPGTINLSSNAATANNTDNAYYYYSYPAGWKVDQTSEITYASAITNADFGVTVRNGGAAGISYYSYDAYTPATAISKRVSGTYTTIETPAGSVSVGDVVKISVVGSTIRYYRNGAEDANSPATDTFVSSAGFGPGFLTGDTGGSVDNWQGVGERSIIPLGAVSGSASNGGDVTLNLSSMPTALADGDLVIVAYGIGDNDNVDETMALVGATGWTKLSDLFANDTQDADLGVFYKIMGATPDTSVTVDGLGGTDASTVAVAMGFRGVDQSTPFDTTLTEATGINTAHANPPSINHSGVEGVVTVAVVVSGNTGGAATTHAAPTGYSSGWTSLSANDTSDVTIGMGYNLTPSDPEDPATSNYSGTDSTSFGWCAVTMALKPAPTVLSATVNQVTETDTAQAFGKSKRKTLGQATETDVAQSFGRLSLKAIGQTTESDTAHAVGKSKRVDVAQTVETDTAFTITKAAVVVEIGLTTETDAAQVVSSSKASAIGQAVETDAATATGSRKLKAIGQASTLETGTALSAAKVLAVGLTQTTDLAQAVGKAKQSTIGQAVESSSAQALVSTKRLAFGQGTESDLATTVTAAKTKSIGLAVESDLAQAVASAKRAPLWQAGESDTAQPISSSSAITVPIGQAVESDAATALGSTKLKAIGQSTETDAAASMAVIKHAFVALGQAQSIESAGTLTASKLKAISIPVESDLAQALTSRKLAGIGLVVQQTHAQPFAWAPMHRLLGVAVETDAAQPMATQLGVIFTQELGVTAVVSAVLTDSLVVGQQLRRQATTAATMQHELDVVATRSEDLPASAAVHITSEV